jgi:hypothetical protein
MIGVDWINLAQDWDNRLAAMNTVFNPYFPKNLENVLNSCGLCAMELVC